MFNYYFNDKVFFQSLIYFEIIFSSFYNQGKWKFASRSAVTTINASVGGGIWAVLYSYKLTKRYKGKLDVASFTSGILGGLVSVTAICAICRPWEALLIGFIGGIITSYGRVLALIHNFRVSTLK